MTAGQMSAIGIGWDVRGWQGSAQAVAEKVQSQAHAQIAAVVTKCLEAIFGVILVGAEAIRPLPAQGSAAAPPAAASPSL